MGSGSGDPPEYGGGGSSVTQNSTISERLLLLADALHCCSWKTLPRAILDAGGKKRLSDDIRALLAADAVVIALIETAEKQRRINF